MIWGHLTSLTVVSSVQCFIKTKFPDRCQEVEGVRQPELEGEGGGGGGGGGGGEDGGDGGGEAEGRYEVANSSAITDGRSQTTNKTTLV